MLLAISTPSLRAEFLHGRPIAIIIDRKCQMEQGWVGQTSPETPESELRQQIDHDELRRHFVCPKSYLPSQKSPDQPRKHVQGACRIGRIRSGGTIGPLSTGNLSLEPARLPVPALDPFP
jgi:hypothetical protein